MSIHSKKNHIVSMSDNELGVIVFGLWELKRNTDLEILSKKGFTLLEKLLEELVPGRTLTLNKEIISKNFIKFCRGKSQNLNLKREQ